MKFYENDWRFFRIIVWSFLISFFFLAVLSWYTGFLIFAITFALILFSWKNTRPRGFEKVALLLLVFFWLALVLPYLIMGIMII
jgi:hypothetical protein